MNPSEQRLRQLLMGMLRGVRHDLGAAVVLPMFRVKVAFVACIAALSVLAVSRLSRPGVRLAWVPGGRAALRYAAQSFDAGRGTRHAPGDRRSVPGGSAAAVSRAWHRNEARRLIKTPKIHLLDSGLAASLAGLQAGDSTARRERFGHPAESFVVQQLIAQAGWTDPDLRFWHYRDKDQVEVDLV